MDTDAAGDTDQEPMPDPGPAPLASDEPVTVVISRIVRPGKQREHEQWVHEAARLLADIDGADGISVLPPGQHHSGPEHVLVLRFRTYDALALWKRSEARRRWLARLPELAEDVGSWQEQSGMETWFTVADRPRPVGPPPRWKQAVLTAGGLLPLVIAIDQILRATLGEVLPPAAKIALTVSVAVPVMVWAVMPGLTRATYRWLYPDER